MNFLSKYKYHIITTAMSWIIATALALINMHFVSATPIAIIIATHAALAYLVALWGFAFLLFEFLK